MFPTKPKIRKTVPAKELVIQCIFSATAIMSSAIPDWKRLVPLTSAAGVKVVRFILKVKLLRGSLSLGQKCQNNQCRPRSKMPKHSVDSGQTTRRSSLNWVCIVFHSINRAATLTLRGGQVV